MIPAVNEQAVLDDNKSPCNTIRTPNREVESERLIYYDDTIKNSCDRLTTVSPIWISYGFEILPGKASEAKKTTFILLQHFCICQHRI